MPVPETFGDRLLRARRQAGLSQEELGKKLGLPVWTISRLERGGRTNLSPDVFRQLSRALNVPLDWLLGGDIPDKPDIVEDPLAPTIGDALGKVAPMVG
jgi:transcriptional regulator with XRE-family HTH domain